MRVASEMRLELATFPDAVFPNDSAAFLTSEHDTPVERFKRNLLIISSSIHRAFES